MLINYAVLFSKDQKSTCSSNKLKRHTGDLVIQTRKWLDDSDKHITRTRFVGGEAEQCAY